MKYNVKNKLCSQNGVSLLFAFLFLLVASMVSAVIVAGATTAVRHVHEDTRREQAYLTLESGAKLLREMLAETTVTITQEESGETETSPEESDGAESSPEESVSDTSEPVPRYEGAGPLGKIMEQAVQSLDEMNEQGENDLVYPAGTIHITAPEVNHKAVFADISAKLVVKKETDSIETAYRVEGTLEFQNGESGSSQKLFLSVPAKLQGNQGELRWKNAELYTRPTPTPEEIMEEEP